MIKEDLEEGFNCHPCEWVDFSVTQFKLFKGIDTSTTAGVLGPGADMDGVIMVEVFDVVFGNDIGL